MFQKSGKPGISQEINSRSQNWKIVRNTLKELSNDVKLHFPLTYNKYSICSLFFIADMDSSQKNIIT